MNIAEERRECEEWLARKRRRDLIESIAAAIIMVIAVTLVVWMATGCGGGFSAADETAARHIVVNEGAALTLCASSATSCNAGQVRAIEAANACAASSILYHHDKAIPDAGVKCGSP